MLKRISKVWNVVWFTSNIDPYINVGKLEDNYWSHQIFKNNLVEIFSIFFLWFISITTHDPIFQYTIEITFNYYHCDKKWKMERCWKMASAFIKPKGITTYSKCNFPFVTFSNTHQVVCTTPVNLSVHLGLI
jgi:hypothetical protein